MEWNIICRICLQEGDMHSIFDRDEDGLLIADKIMSCSNLEVRKLDLCRIEKHPRLEKVSGLTDARLTSLAALR